MSIRYTERLAEAGIEPSVGSFGDSYDNALEQEPSDLNRKGFPDAGEMLFTMRAGQEASMHG